jgi:hypothetical protein
MPFYRQHEYSFYVGDDRLPDLRKSSLVVSIFRLNVMLHLRATSPSDRINSATCSDNRADRELIKSLLLALTARNADAKLEQERKRDQTA